MDKRAGTEHTRLSAFILLALVVLPFLFASGCTDSPVSPSSRQSPQVTTAAVPGASWKETVLPDLQGRGDVSISRFAGKIVMVPIVSASCPSCIVQLNRQLAEIDRLYRKNPEQIVIISLDIDPDYGPSFITAYGEPAGFAGYTARSPPDMTLQLFHRFGPFAMDTDSIPVILVCPNGHDLLLPPGVKTAESLSESIAREC
ncbi:MAG: hypothetical protein Q8R70_01105 [Methanoregula sp.]|nr:hypothetical protein [Methanoregula sp.]